MSIVCLKRKSRHNPRIDPISGIGKNGFSLNGGHRNIGGVGRFRMVSNVSRTPFRGPAPIGSGGCCGIYDKNICNSGSCCTNDNAIIKHSSINTKGMINTRYERKWSDYDQSYICPRVVLNSQYPYSWTQIDNSSYNITNSQGLYIREKTQENGTCVVSNLQNSGTCGNYDLGVLGDLGADADAHVYKCAGNSNACSYYIGTRKFIRKPYAKNFNQPAISQGQYITTGGLAKKNCLPPGANKQPFPMNLVHNQGIEGCDVNYDTWQQAQLAGALPPNYVG
jgi:hypothetical protein